MFICAFTAWVRGPSILFTFILQRCHALIISVIVVTRRSTIFIDHFLWHLITVNHSRTNFLLCTTGSNWHTSIYEPWDWLVWAIDSSQPAMVAWWLDQMSSHVAIFWVLSLAFRIKVFGDVYHWLLSPWCYIACMLAVPTCRRQNLGATPSRLDVQKYLDDLLHTAGKASSLLSGWGQSYNHSQCTHRALQELDIPEIEMGTAVIINNLWSILNNTTANMAIRLTPIFLAGWFIFVHLELFLPLALSSWQLHKGDGRGEEIQGRHQHHLHEPEPEMCFVMPSLPDLRTHLRS